MVMNILSPLLSLKPCRTVKIQVGDLVSSTMETKLNVNSRASDLLAQFHHQFIRSPEHGKGKMRRYGTAFNSTLFCVHFLSSVRNVVNCNVFQQILRVPKLRFDLDIQSKVSRL